MPPAQVAERTGLSLDTLRYYEREGLIGPVDRDSGGKRRYSDDDVFWIGLISCLRDAGLGIADLRQFTSMLREGDPAGDRVGFLVRHRSELQRRVRQIETAISVLDDKIVYYSAAD
ncbi:MerR family transcriptional regulator [Micromonospora sp. MMS20-R2-23]|uniref:MerR family transcriptional regulator n=2 Tax=Micromonosporaceae TaxID=28056 RepID=A0ABS3V8L4_9ACTN|nr:MerR family transcriptional regulator [Micromonospora antibiotica]